MKSCFLLLTAALLSPLSLSAQSKFEQWDADKNGKLTKEELPIPLQKNFARVDRDKDGFISKAEHEAVGKKAGRNRNVEISGVKKILNLDYSGEKNPRQMVDLYLPEKPVGEEPLPLIVWIHGGGWQNGSKDNAGRITEFVKSGKYAGASVGYRLTDEAHWPSQIHDCKAAIRFLKANAEKYGYDADKIGIWGSSAGGHLVAMLGVSNGVADLEGRIGPHTDLNAEVMCVVDYFGPTDLLNMNNQGSTMDHNVATSPEGKLVGGEISKTPDVAASASPITHVTKDDEPILIFHGTRDQLVPYQQSVDFKKKLDEAGVESAFITIKNGGHGAGFPAETREIISQFFDHQLYGVGEMPKDRELAAAKGSAPR